ncbi:[FeFe] hydrogenase H-cluster radical SAM maturase HydE [Gallicola sp. Sow4_E12]|uniref:[FeFe] hydrogenase H-cluster radical SAM maturase HydE n=1 Tax=Gallicola sp. Sow4_E12 TaxID=3438785 RepID=UPI003F93C305
MNDMIQKLQQGQELKDDELLAVLKNEDPVCMEELRKIAEEKLFSNCGNKVYIRGLVEYSNYCRENCRYCGIQRDNKNIERFRLTKEEILSSVHKGYKLGFRTFVLQGGEDPFLTKEFFTEIIREIKNYYPETRITLSLGVKSFEELKAFKDAGADRFLLRHEAASEELFHKLHPDNQSFAKRKETLYSLKELGFVTGTGFMIGAPSQTAEDLVADFNFIKELQPEMIGVGPFIPQKDTKYKDYAQGDLNLSLRIVALLRILFPKALIPSTTALNSIDKKGRTLGLQYGANVIMPNLSPDFAKEKYKLYDHKAITDLESGEHIKQLQKEMEKIGRTIVIDTGDPIR